MRYRYSNSVWMFGTIAVLTTTLSAFGFLAKGKPLRVALSHGSRTPSGAIVGQSKTLLANGSLLLIGGDGPRGPVATAAIEDMQTGAITTLLASLHYARAWHTATMLPNGTVLVLGGIGADGHVVNTAELFDPRTEVFSVASPTGLSARAYHTATVLTDGRVLVAGGVSPSGATLSSLQTWDFRTNSVTNLPEGLSVPRIRQVGTLLPDGTVLFSGGLDNTGVALDFDEIFNPRTNATFVISTQQPTSIDPPQFEGALPDDGASDVPVNSCVAVRFSEPLNVTSLNPSTVALSDAQGAVALDIVPVENGRLAFVNPKSSLSPGTGYTLSIQGATNSSGEQLPTVLLSFTTANPGASSAPPSYTGSGASDFWVPSSSNFQGQWASGHGRSPYQNLPPLRTKPGVTALAGQALRLNGLPLDRVTLQIDSVKTTTDGTGRFLLEGSGLSAGHHILLIDGTTANRQGLTYGIFEVGVDLVAGNTTALNYTIWMTALDAAHAVTIPSPTTQETVVSTPLLPGLELHLAPNTVIRDHNGNVVTTISITPVPVDQPPFPLPTGINVPIYFTIQPGDAYIDTQAGAWVKGAQLYYPNSHNAAPGTVFDFWNYDAEQKGWYVYGTGTVSNDGKQIVPGPGVEIYDFTGAMVGSPSVEKGQGCVDPGNCPTAGEPVDLGSGEFVYTKTDLFLPDVIPLQLTRTYTTNDSVARSFGIGAMQYYDMLIAGDDANYTYIELMLPNGERVYFYRTSAGNSYSGAVYADTQAPGPWYGATIAYTNTSGFPGAAWELTKKDGTIYFFPDAFAQTNPAKMALIGIRDRNGNTLTINRDVSGNVMSVVSPNLRYITFLHDSNNRIVQAQDDTGRTVSYTYDSGGRLSTVTDAKGGMTTFTYDSNNNMLTIEDARQITYLTNQYDSKGRVLKQTLADGGTYQFAWTTGSAPSLAEAEFGGSGNLPPGGSATAVVAFRNCSDCSEGYQPLISKVDVTDPRGIVREVQFGTSGQMSTDTYALGTPQQQTFTYTYYADNLLESVTDPLGRETTYTYDANGNLTQVTRLAGTQNALTTSFGYDPTFSQLTSVTDPLTNTTSFGLDSHGNTTSITDPLTHQTTISYDSEGRPLSMTDPLTNVTHFAYDTVGGDLVSITDPLNRITSQSFDGAGRVVGRTDPLGETTKYAYDNLNEMTSVTDPLNGQTSFAYDPNGNLLSVTDANGNTTNYSYDNMDRLAARTDPLNRTESYQYDGDGNLTQFSDRRNEVTTYTYDNLNRRAFSGFNTQAGPTYESTINYTYDAGNRLTQAVDSVTGTIARSYDGLDRLTEETTPEGSVSYSYDDAGRRTSLTVAGQTAINYSYDNANRLTQIAQGSSTVSFGYDNANRRTSLTLPNGVTMSNSYDVASQLTGINYTLGQNMLGNLTYGYDLAGRRTTVGGSFATANLPNPVFSTGYDAANELTQWGTATPTYDANGNTLSDGTNTYVWNGRNQLASMNSGAESFQYDPFGRRFAKAPLVSTTNYLYDGANPVQELSGTTPTASILEGLNVDEYFQRTDSSGSANFLTDALGSTLALTDSNGNIIDQYTYEPFGNTNVGGTSTNPYQYTGRENDGAGLYFNRNRYYAPTLQRFLSEDPIGLRGSGPDFYSYVGNNPINLSDPRGLTGFGVSVGGGAFAGGGPGFGGSLSLGGVYFPSTNSSGGYLTEGSFAGSNGSFGNYQTNQTGGLSAGAGPGIVITSANSIGDLAGTFNNTTYSILWLNIDFAYSPNSGVWVLNVSGGGGGGLGFSQYCTNTYTSPVSSASFAGRKDNGGCSTGF